VEKPWFFVENYRKSCEKRGLLSRIPNWVEVLCGKPNACFTSFLQLVGSKIIMSKAIKLFHIFHSPNATKRIKNFLVVVFLVRLHAFAPKIFLPCSQRVLPCLSKPASTQSAMKLVCVQSDLNTNLSLVSRAVPSHQRIRFWLMYW